MTQPPERPEGEGVLSLAEWREHFPPLTHTHGYVFARLTPPPPLSEYPDCLVVDWVPERIYGVVGFEIDGVVCTAGDTLATVTPF